MKSSYQTIIAALLIAAGIFFLGLFIKSGIDNMAFRDRQVTVKGLAEREVEANHVTWPIQYSVAGDNLISLYDQVTSYNDKIINFLTSNGIERNDISINPRHLQRHGQPVQSGEVQLLAHVQRYGQHLQCGYRPQTTQPPERTAQGGDSCYEFLHQLRLHRPQQH